MKNVFHKGLLPLLSNIGKWKGLLFLKRDMEYIRQLLIDFSEGKGKRRFATSTTQEPTPEFLEDKKYEYHLKILKQAGLITYDAYPAGFGVYLKELPELTWTGQDYLGAIEDDTIWTKVKSGLKEQGMELNKIAMSTLVEYAKFKGKEWLGLT